MNEINPYVVIIASALPYLFAMSLVIAYVVHMIEDELDYRKYSKRK